MSVAEVVEVSLNAESEVSRLGETDEAVSVKAEEAVSVIEAVEKSARYSRLI